MAFGGHERERLVVRVEDEDAGRQLDRGAGHGLDLEQRDLARLDARQRSVEPLALRPELGKVRLPRRDDGLRRRVHAVETDRERLLPQLAEALQRTGHALPGHGVVLRAGDPGGRQAIRPAWPSSRRNDSSSVRPSSAPGSFGSIMARSPRLPAAPGQAVAASDGRVLVVDDLDRLVEAGQLEDLAVVIGQPGRDQAPPTALGADQQGHQQADAATVHVLELAEVEDHRRRPVRDREAVRRAEVAFAGGRDVARDAQDRGRAFLVELDDGGGHAASPSTISMKSESRVIRKISR